MSSLLVCGAPKQRLRYAISSPDSVVFVENNAANRWIGRFARAQALFPSIAGFTEFEKRACCASLKAQIERTISNGSRDTLFVSYVLAVCDLSAQAIVDYSLFFSSLNRERYDRFIIFEPSFESYHDQLPYLFLSVCILLLEPSKCFYFLGGREVQLSNIDHLFDILDKKHTQSLDINPRKLHSKIMISEFGLRKVPRFFANEIHRSSVTVLGKTDRFSFAINEPIFVEETLLSPTWRDLISQSVGELMDIRTISESFITKLIGGFAEHVEALAYKIHKRTIWCSIEQVWISSSPSPYNALLYYYVIISKTHLFIVSHSDKLRIKFSFDPAVAVFTGKCASRGPMRGRISEYELSSIRGESARKSSVASFWALRFLFTPRILWASMKFELQRLRASQARLPRRGFTLGILINPEFTCSSQWVCGAKLVDDLFNIIERYRKLNFTSFILRPKPGNRSSFIYSDLFLTRIGGSKNIRIEIDRSRDLIKISKSVKVLYFCPGSADHILSTQMDVETELLAKQRSILYYDKAV